MKSIVRSNTKQYRASLCGSVGGRLQNLFNLASNMTTFDKKCLLAVNHRCISLGKHSTIRDPTITAEPVM